MKPLLVELTPVLQAQSVGVDDNVVLVEQVLIVSDSESESESEMRESSGIEPEGEIPKLPNPKIM